MTRLMMKPIYGLLVLALGTTTAAAAVKSGDWLLRGGAAWVHPNDSSGEVSGIAGSGVSVDDATSLGLTVTYMLQDNWGVEVLAAWPFKHDIQGEGSISGLDKIATAKQLPPTVSVQYQFMPGNSIRPYLGVGVNYTTFFSEKASSSLETALGGSTDVSLKDSWGLSVSGGVDIDWNEDWFLNLAAWYTDIDTTARLRTGGSTRHVDVTIDPLVLMVGVGRRF